MNKLEYRSVTKFFVLDGLSQSEIHPKLIKVYKESSPSLSTVNILAAEFKQGHTLIKDDPREGWSKTATTQNIVDNKRPTALFLAMDVLETLPPYFSPFLEYMYCDHTAMDNVEEAGQLLYAAKKYLIPHLAHNCRVFLLENTHINTLWDVLAFAEDLHEEELLSACLKVMCQYPGEMWINNNEHVGLVTLSKLLDQSSTNLLEVELWKLVVAWANDQCALRSLKPTNANKRALINQAGVLDKVRFLTLSASEITDTVEPSGLLSDEELRALRSFVAGSKTKVLPADENVSVPVGFNPSREARKRFMSISGRCVRQCLTKRKQYTYCGTIKSKVSADRRILVTGFEVFTRIATTADYIMGHGSVNQYLEDLVMILCDKDGNLISRTDLTGIVSFFNVTQEIYLSKPVWFLPKQEYTVAFELSNGQYPLSDLSPIARDHTKSLCFRFSRCHQIIDGSIIDLDVSFINSVIFNV